MIERSPPEATHRFEHRVLDFAEDLGWPWAFGGAFYRLAESAFYSEPSRRSGFIAATIPI